MKRDRYKRMVIFAEVLLLLAVYTLLYAHLWNALYEDIILIPFFRRVDMVFSNVFNVLVANTIIYFILVALLACGQQEGH